MPQNVSRHAGTAHVHLPLCHQVQDSIASVVAAKAASRTEAIACWEGDRRKESKLAHCSLCSGLQMPAHTLVSKSFKDLQFLACMLVRLLHLPCRHSLSLKQLDNGAKVPPRLAAHVL